MADLTNSELNKTNVAPKEELENLLRRMGETRMPPNRIYEAMRMQLEELRRGFEKNGGELLSETEQRDLDERINSVLKLSDIYQKTLKAKGNNISAEERKQAETVGNIKDAIRDQKLYVKEHAVEKEIEKVKDQTRGYVDTMRKSMEAYMISQREIGNLANGVENFDVHAQDKARIGLAAMALYEKLADPESGQKFYENFLSSGSDYAKTVQTIASSGEFKAASKDILKPSELKNFLSEPKAAGNLWKSFEKEMQKAQTKEVKTPKAVKENMKPSVLKGLPGM